MVERVVLNALANGTAALPPNYLRLQRFPLSSSSEKPSTLSQKPPRCVEVLAECCNYKHGDTAPWLQHLPNGSTTHGHNGFEIRNVTS